MNWQPDGRNGRGRSKKRWRDNLKETLGRFGLREIEAENRQQTLQMKNEKDFQMRKILEVKLLKRKKNNKSLKMHVHYSCIMSKKVLRCPHHTSLFYNKRHFIDGRASFRAREGVRSILVTFE